MSAIGSEARLLPKVQGSEIDNLASIVDNLQLGENPDTAVDPIITQLATDTKLNKKGKSLLAQQTVQLMSDNNIEPKLRLIVLMAYIRKKELGVLCEKVSATYYPKIGEALNTNKQEKHWHVWLKKLKKGPTLFSDDIRNNMYNQAIKNAQDRLKNAIDDSGYC